MFKNGEWVKWGIGLIMTFLCIILPFMGNAIVANDDKSRDRDKAVEDCLDKSISEQNKVNQAMLIQLAKMDGKFETLQVDISYIKEKVK